MHSSRSYEFSITIYLIQKSYLSKQQLWNWWPYHWGTTHITGSYWLPTPLNITTHLLCCVPCRYVYSVSPTIVCYPLISCLPTLSPRLISSITSMDLPEPMFQCSSPVAGRLMMVHREWPVCNDDGQYTIINSVLDKLHVYLIFFITHQQ